MRTNNNTRLAKIKSEHCKILQMVRDNILKNGDVFVDDVGDIRDIIAYDEKQIKRYEDITRMMGIIESIVEQIIDATTIEEITKIRERLNYYINKIKKEIKNRNLSDEIISKYCYHSSCLRQEIAKCIRVLKRDVNIDKMQYLLSKDSLSCEEESLLKKMLQNENKFNKRYLNMPKKAISKPKDDTPFEKTALVNNLKKVLFDSDYEFANDLKHELQSLKLSDSNLTTNDTDFDELTVLKKKTVDDSDLQDLDLSINKSSVEGSSDIDIMDELRRLNCEHDENQSKLMEEASFESSQNGNDAILSEMNELLNFQKDDDLNDMVDSIHKTIMQKMEKTDDDDSKKIDAGLNFSFTTYDSKNDFLSDMIDKYTEQYDIVNLRKYGSKRSLNIKKFFKNLPAYYHNKEAVADMKYASRVHYNGSDFISFIAYTKKRNSIKNALRTVFSRTYLHSFEGKCLNDHNRCIEWLKKYCEERNLEISFFTPNRVRSI